MSKSQYIITGKLMYSVDVDKASNICDALKSLVCILICHCTMVQVCVSVCVRVCVCVKYISSTILCFQIPNAVLCLFLSSFFTVCLG